MTTATKPHLLPTRYQPPTNPLTTANIRVCPECAGPLVRNTGYVNCWQCG